MGGRLLCLPPSLCRDELEAQLRRFLSHVLHLLRFILLLIFIQVSAL